MKDEDKFTLADERTIQEMLAEYEQKKEQIALIHAAMEAELSEQQEQVINSYEEDREFLSDVRKSLDFTKASTVNVAVGDLMNGETQVQSLYQNSDEYAEIVTSLTAGFDADFQREVEATREIPVYKEIDTNVTQFNSIVNAPLSNPEISELIDKKSPEKSADVLTVGELVAITDYTQELFREYDIREDSVLKDTMGELQLNIEQGKAYVLSEEKSEFSIDDRNVEHEDDKPVEFTESSDGYVMNTSEVITAENYHQVSDKIENENEVVHTEPPRYTTNDLSEVGGNVELEEFDELGTIEEAQGVLTEETEEQLEKDDLDLGL